MEGGGVEGHRYLGVVTLANYSILYAETALDEDYYRLTDVESRIPKFCVGEHAKGGSLTRCR